MPPLLELRRAIGLLLQAQQYAEELRRDPWDFAVEWTSLRETGLTNNDIRWLIYQGFLKQGVEALANHDFLTVQQRNGRSRLTDGSCFLLTSDGFQFAREFKPQVEERNAEPCAKEMPHDHYDGAECETLLTPAWDRHRRTLVFGRRVVKRYKVPAPNQEIILATFEEEDWPVRIDDPLPRHVNIVAKQRLHDTITSLNRNQENRLVRFFGDGSGEAICWEVRLDV